MKTAFVIIHYNDYPSTSNLLENIKSYKFLDLVVVVDNGSTDSSYEKLKKYENKKIKILREKENKGFAAGLNRGSCYAIEKLKDCFLILSNADLLIGSEENLIELTDAFKQKDLGVVAPVLKVINDEFGIEKGFMSTVHAFTNDQETLDISHKKGIYARRGRAASQNIIPATTGAASAIGLVIPELQGKLDGLAYRVPVPDGSLIDVTLELKNTPSVDEINNAFLSHQSESLKFTKDPVVSSDIIGKRYGALVDGLLTNFVEVDGKRLYKIVAWYDNELGYTAQMLRTAKAMFK